jgi:hypothetical protein
MATPTKPEPAPQTAPLSGQVLLYQNPEPLDPARHGKLGMKSSDRPYGFARGQNFVPVHVGEFPQVAVNYPIIFAGEDFAPIAVLGVQQGENLFIADDGLYRLGAYIPAFIRRYPFVGARDDAAQRTIICIDRAFDRWTETDADAVLFENGQPSEFTRNCIEFCRQFDQDRQVSDQFVRMLRDLDLFDTKQTHFTPRLADGTNGEPVLVAEYYAISDEKVRALPEAKIAELCRNGGLTAIDAHLISLNNWDKLILDSSARQMAMDAANS